MKKSRTVAAMMAFLGGMFGVDRFYLGQHQLGIFFTFLTIIGISSFGIPIAALAGFLHGAYLLTSTDEQFDKKYNKGYQNRNRKRQTRVQRENNRASRELRDMDMQREKYAYKKQTKQRNNPFLSSGAKKHKEYDLDGAILDYEQALELSPKNIKLHYNLASVYSLKENVKKSLYHLDEAIKLGFKDQEKILKADDLAYIRIQPEFEAFKNNGFKLRGTKGIEAPKSKGVKDDVLLTQLNKLKDLRDRGLLSQKEFLYEQEKLTRK